MTEVIEGEVIDVPDKSLAQWTPKFVVTVDEAVARHDERIDYMRRVLKEGVHYGKIPGTGDKAALFKPGAESLCADMGLRPDPINDGAPILDFDGRDHNGEPFIYYQRKVNLYRLHPVTGDRVWVGAGSGSCTSWEDKYRWRTSVRTCPECGKAAIIKGKAEYGGGWICFRKKDGCGAKFPDGAVSITSQQAGRVANDRIADLANTILKMADKRALVAAVLNTTGVSDLFTQDLEDESTPDDEERARVEDSRTATAPKSNAVPADELVERAKRETATKDTSGAMADETRKSIDKARERANAVGTAAAQIRLKGWGYKTWAAFLAEGSALQAAEIIAVLGGERVSA